MTSYHVEFSSEQDIEVRECAQLSGETVAEFIVGAVQSRIDRRRDIEIDVDDRVYEKLDRNTEKGQTTSEFASALIRDYLTSKTIDAPPIPEGRAETVVGGANPRGRRSTTTD